jgi:peptide/nickel transport system substrate-binding protein
MVRPIALTAAITASLLAVAGAGGAATQQTPKRGGTLVIAIPGVEPACLNILDDRCNPPQPILNFLVSNVFETAFDIDDGLQSQPNLASASYTRRPPFTLVYRIRPEARWSDNVPITARDFIFTLDAIRKYGDPNARRFHAVIRSARVVDSKTVRVVLRSRFAAWRDLFGFVLPAHALRGEDLSRIWSDRIDNPKTGAAIGSGPFLVERLERGKQLVLRRNPNYWGPHRAYLDRLAVRFRSPASDPTEDLRSGELHVAQGVAPALIGPLRGTGLRVSVTPATGFEHFDLRIGGRGHPALKKKLVRRALALAINRNAIVRQVVGDIDPNARPLESAVVLERSRYYERNWSRYRYRPSEARRLLEQAGCRRASDGVYSCAGERLSLRFVTNADAPTRARILSLVQVQLRAAGIEAVPEYAPPSVFLNQMLPQGDFDAALFSFGFQVDSAGVGDIYGCGRPGNFTGYCQRLVTADLDQADRILDASQRARVLNRVDRWLASDVPVIPLYQFRFTAAQAQSVRGYVLSPFNSFWNSENWWLADRS